MKRLTNARDIAMTENAPDAGEELLLAAIAFDELLFQKCDERLCRRDASCLHCEPPWSKHIGEQVFAARGLSRQCHDLIPRPLGMDDTAHGFSHDQRVFRSWIEHIATNH